jgi:hypothetical protein
MQLRLGLLSVLAGYKMAAGKLNEKQEWFEK